MGKSAEPHKAALLELLSSPIAYYATLAKVGGGVTSGVFLSQLIYWTGRGKLADGWLWKSADEFEAETGLTRNEQETARRNLRERGLIEERLAGVPATLHYRINLDAILLAVSQFGEKCQTSLAKSDKLVSGKAPNYPETTTQNTPQITDTESGTVKQTAPQQQHGANAQHAPKAAAASSSEPEPKKETAKDIPAATVYHGLTHRWPPRATWDGLRSVGDCELWKQVVAAWIGTGWNPGNLKGMLEFYRRGEIPGTQRRNGGKGNGNGQQKYASIGDAFAALLADEEAAMAENVIDMEVMG